MSIYAMPAENAVELFHSNPTSRWYRSGADVGDPSGDLAVQRLKRPVFDPRVLPEFRLESSDRLYAIGSCFARGIEKALASHGYDVLSAAEEFDGFELSRPGVTGLGFTNKYTTYSIVNELSWALDPGVEFPLGTLVDLEEDVWVDPHTNPTLKFVDYERTLERREIIRSVTRRLADARLVVITLGLVETWRDDREHVYLNMTPTPPMVRRYPGRYSFHVLDFAENRANLERVHELLTGHGHPDVQIVVTVSPVPLMATFTDRDVVVANTYSKALLRTAAEDWAAAHENVHYFPSYEIALNSDKGLAWAEDGRHVRGDLVKEIMRVFMDTYAAGSRDSRVAQGF